MAAVKSIGLAKMYWGDVYKGKLWAMIGPDGKPAKRGSPIDPLARLNKDGMDAHAIIEELEDKRVICESRIKDLQATNKRIASKCAMINKAILKADKEQNFYLQGYTKSLRTVGKARGEIETATKVIAARMKDLDVAKEKYIKFEIGEQLAKKKAKLESIKKERDATLAVLKKVLSYAKPIMKGDLVSMVDVALKQITEKSVKVDFEPKLKALKKEIKVLEGRSTEADEMIAKGEVAAAALWLSAQLTDLKNKERNLNAALENAAEMRKQAIDIFEGKHSTRGLARIMEEKKNHLKQIEWAKGDISIYKTSLTRMKKDLNALTRIYGSVGGFLKKASVKDSAYSPKSDYGKAVIKMAGSNGSLLLKWQNHASVQLKFCATGKSYLDDTGPGGPLAEYNSIQEKVANTRKISRRLLKKAGLQCPA